MGLHVFPGALVMSAHEGHNQAAAQPKLKSKIAAIARQATRIGELGGALVADGLVTLDDQARALGLSRSTAWAVLKANHKATGLTAATIDRMLSSPELPPRARATILTYVEEKLAGLYGHNKTQLRGFAAFMVDATALSDRDAWKDHPTKYAA
jgi:hypothetical protein